MAKKRISVSGSERKLLPGARAVGAPSPDERIEISVLLRPRRSYKTIQSSNVFKPVRPKERQYLSRQEFEKAYGADPKDVQKVEAFAHAHDLTVMQASLPRRTVVLAGTVAQLAAAFGVEMALYEHEGHTYRGRSGPVSVPEDLSGIVQGVFGLDNRRQARQRLRRRQTQPGLNRQTTPAYAPNQVASLYNFPAGANGAGQCIGILEFGGGYKQSDLQTYFSKLGISMPSITAVSVDGVQNQPAPGGDSPDTEVDLDIEVAGAAAPEASIVVYFSNFTERGWVDALTTAVHDSLHNPSVLSVSWGYPEGQLTWTSQAMQVVNESLQAAAAMGITVCVASGDDGSRDEVDDGLAHVDFPASSPYVLACGGTTLHSSNNTISSEVVWNDGADGGASGGGVSEVFPLPAWQSKANVPPSVNPGHNAGRGVPDVAGDADPNTGYEVISDGQGEVVGGTSAVSPLWSALIARINQKLGKPVGFVNSLIYAPTVATSSAFRDITSGNNDVASVGAYSAGKGWDACTGLGSPNGAALLAALTAGGAASGAKPKPPKRGGKKP
ncbi:MAG: S53 family peptidase, partial [Terriglobia bacterium]